MDAIKLTPNTGIVRQAALSSPTPAATSSQGGVATLAQPMGPQDSVTLSDPNKTPEKSPVYSPKDSKFSVRLNFANDNGPAFMSRQFGNDSNRQPGTQDFADDDGWTADTSIQAVRQNGQNETVVGARLRMLTQTGSWQRNQAGSNYQGLRTDVGEFVVQKNQTKDLDSKTKLTLGLGGGVQTFGDIGGESLQRWWHKDGPFGGRTGTDLQGQYTSDGVRGVPLLTGGASLTRSLNKNVDLNLSGQANVPVGRGVGQASLLGSVSSSFGPVSLEAGAKLDGAWSNAPETSFHDIDGLRAGAFGRVEVDGKYGSLYSQIETGGFRNEPTFSLGVRIGLGKTPKLDPFR